MLRLIDVCAAPGGYYAKATGPKREDHEKNNEGRPSGRVLVRGRRRSACGRLYAGRGRRRGLAAAGNGDHGARAACDGAAAAFAGAQAGGGGTRAGGRSGARDHGARRDGTGARRRQRAGDARELYPAAGPRPGSHHRVAGPAAIARRGAAGDAVALYGSGLRARRLFLPRSPDPGDACPSLRSQEP
mgnify:CR=1 FL=1